MKGIAWQELPWDLDDNGHKKEAEMKDIEQDHLGHLFASAKYPQCVSALLCQRYLALSPSRLDFYKLPMRL